MKQLITFMAVLALLAACKTPEPSYWMKPSQAKSLAYPAEVTVFSDPVAVSIAPFAEARVKIDGNVIVTGSNIPFRRGFEYTVHGSVVGTVAPNEVRWNYRFEEADLEGYDNDEFLADPIEIVVRMRRVDSVRRVRPVIGGPGLDDLDETFSLFQEYIAAFRPASDQFSVGDAFFVEKPTTGLIGKFGVRIESRVDGKTSYRSRPALAISYQFSNETTASSVETEMSGAGVVLYDIELGIPVYDSELKTYNYISNSKYFRSRETRTWRNYL